MKQNTHLRQEHHALFPTSEIFLMRLEYLKINHKNILLPYTKQWLMNC